MSKPFSPSLGPASTSRLSNPRHKTWNSGSLWCASVLAPSNLGSDPHATQDGPHRRRSRESLSLLSLSLSRIKPLDLVIGFETLSGPAPPVRQIWKKLWRVVVSSLPLLPREKNSTDESSRCVSYKQENKRACGIESSTVAPTASSATECSPAFSSFCL